ncbi:polyketide synthase (plasmid) [Streptomyces sp. NBC_01717]|uniref:type I polyketide synthase n=1 Tax=Streptomyces sp. NBC_01717 TaxID=2975918 RepID=UPI002E33F6A8|nr:beta-ketoacyl synthase N-terminal-like domain-containing protein [Streptomyces sp. NBC_01717]
MNRPTTPTRTREPVAIVGMACRFPGAPGVDALWDLLRTGGDATNETPPDRYDIEALYAPEPTRGKVISRRSGYLPDVAGFDADFFGLTAEEATHLDPQQRLLMMLAWEALEDSGIPPQQIEGTRTGVYVGSVHLHYAELNARRGLSALRPSSVHNVYSSLLSGRLSYTFDLRGPSISVDTACSSSLVAIHLACQSLRSGETTLALAAGVNLKFLPDEDVMLSQMPIIAPDGRCKFGDERADGFAPSDGAGVVVLKPLSAALADGDRIRALILGSAISNDGRSVPNQLAPSVEGQVQMLRWAYEDAGVPPAEVDFIEAHGTGTPAIDPVEFAAFGEVLGKDRSADRPCYVGSVKSNIGHAEGAAGIAALIKTVLCLEHRQIVPSLHYETPNPKIPWQDLPLRVPTEPLPIPDRGRPLIAGISGQGISAANTHLVISQADHPTPCEPPPAGGPHLFVTSARTDSALRDTAIAYLAYLTPEGSGSAHRLADICRSAALNRHHHVKRLAILAGTHQELSDRLQAFLDGELHPPRADDTTLQALAHDYLAGEPVKWASAFPQDTRYVPLPTYPWQTKRYWLD